MNVTEVRIKLMNDPHERLLAFCSITLDDCFVVRDLKIIQGTRGAFVAMPSRKLTDHCGRCHAKNHLRARFCSECGARLDETRAETEGASRTKLYADIAHPINSECREGIQSEIIAGYERELVLAEQPGYSCTYDDYGEDRVAAVADEPDTVPVNGNGNGHSHSNGNGNGSATTPSEVTAPAARRDTTEPRRRFDSTDERTHRIDPGNPRSVGPHDRNGTPQRALSRNGDDGFAEGIA